MVTPLSLTDVKHQSHSDRLIVEINYELQLHWNGRFAAIRISRLKNFGHFNHTYSETVASLIRLYSCYGWSVSLESDPDGDILFFNL
jgi:hypothetical protein